MVFPARGANYALSLPAGRFLFLCAAHLMEREKEKKVFTPLDKLAAPRRRLGLGGLRLPNAERHMQVMQGGY